MVQSGLAQRIHRHAALSCNASGGWRLTGGAKPPFSLRAMPTPRIPGFEDNALIIFTNKS
jgi:hypothetical protein